ncbi:MAG: hypothetical protein ACMUIM_03670 [bacterium]
MMTEHGEYSKFLPVFLLLSILIIGGLSIYMVRMEDVSAETDYWTYQMTSYPLNDTFSFTNWSQNAFTYSWPQTYPGFPGFGFPSGSFGFPGYRWARSYPVASPYGWEGSFMGLSPFGVYDSFGWPPTSFSSSMSAWPLLYSGFPIASFPASFGGSPMGDLYPFPRYPRGVPTIVDIAGSSVDQGVGAEEYAVYSAYIRQSEYGKKDKLLIQENTSTHISKNDPFTMDALVARLPEQMPQIAQETIYDFYSRNQKSYPLGKFFNIDTEYDLVDDTLKVLMLSRVGFNAMRTQAMFEEGYMAGALAGYGMYVLMIKVNGVWTVNDFAASWRS